LRLEELEGSNGIFSDSAVLHNDRLDTDHSDVFLVTALLRVPLQHCRGVLLHELLLCDDEAPFLEDVRVEHAFNDRFKALGNSIHDVTEVVKVEHSCTLSV
jgi:hypothetical protein